MEIERIIVHKRKPMPNKMHLGFEGDNMVRRIAFDLPEVSDAQTATLMYGGKYADMISLVKDGGQWIADLTAEMIGEAGEVEGYVRVDGPTGEVWHSDILKIVTGDVPAVEVQIEKLYPTAVDQMLTAMAEHTTAMDAAVERAEAAAERAESAGGGGGSGGGGGITQETDPTVPAWAKQPEKPTYTADEVGALAADAPVVRYEAQELTAEQQAQARENVGAQPKGDYALKTDIPEPYVLPTASATVKGGVMVGKGLEMDGEALGVVPEEEYELLRSITVTDDTVIEYVITDVMLDALRTTVLAPASGLKNASVVFQYSAFARGGGLTVGGTYISTTVVFGSRLDTYKARKVWEAESRGGGTSHGTSTVTGPGRVDVMNPASDEDYISYVRVYVYNEDGNGFPVGTVINIYGVRHNG